MEDGVGKLLIIVVLVLGFLWWKSDNDRIKWIHELEDKVAGYEQRIEELESELYDWRGY